jgi:hypothetical protein
MVDGISLCFFCNFYLTRIRDDNKEEKKRKRKRKTIELAAC